MSNATWIGGGNNQASNAKDWSPTGVPKKGTLLTMAAGTMDISGSILSGDTLDVIGSSTLNLSNVQSFTADIGQYNPGGGPLSVYIATTINMSGKNTNVEIENAAFNTVTVVNLARNAVWEGGFSLVSGGERLDTGGTLTINGAAGSSFQNNGTSDIGDRTVINANVAGTGTIVVQGVPSVDNTLELNGTVGAGQTIDVSGYTGSLQIDKPTQFSGIVSLDNDIYALVDLRNLPTVTSYRYANDLLTLYDGGNIVDTLRLTSSEPLTVSKTGTDVYIGPSGIKPANSQILPSETAPVISGTVANQRPTTPLAYPPSLMTVDPFSTVSIADSASVAITITLSVGGVIKDSGTLTSPDGGLKKTGTGTYTVSAASVAAVTQILDQLVFTPSVDGTTNFKITATDTAKLSATDTTTSVIAATINKTWIGGGNNQATNPNDWSPTGVPQSDDGVSVFSGTMNINTTLPMSVDVYGDAHFNLTNATISAIDISGENFGNRETVASAVIDMTGNNQVNLGVGNYAVGAGYNSATVNINGIWIGTLNVELDGTATLSGGQWDNDGSSSEAYLGGNATIDSNVIGTGTISMNDRGASAKMTFLKSVGAGQTIDMNSYPSNTTSNTLVIDDPAGFQAAVSVGSSDQPGPLIQINDLPNVASYSFSHDMLAFYGSNGKQLDLLKFSDSSAFSVEKSGATISIYGSNPPVNSGTILPLHG